MSEDQYRLERGLASSFRLNLQHYLIHRLFGYLLHPAVDINKPDLRVADIATGTGYFTNSYLFHHIVIGFILGWSANPSRSIWLTELAQELPPTSRLDGFDISSEPFPQENNLPRNVTLHVGNCLKPPPQEFHEKYDIVHLRLLKPVVVDDDPGPVVEHVKALLSEFENTIFSDP